MNARIIYSLSLAILIALLPTAGAQEANGDLSRAQALLTAGKYGSAAEAFTRIIALAPESSPAYHGRGIARIDLKNYADAITDFDRALALDPSDSIGYNERGYAKMRMGDLKGALPDYARCIALDPNYAPVHTNRGILLRTSGDAQGAMQDFNRALAIAPGNERALTERASLKLGMGDSAGAMADGNVIIRADPKNAGAYFNRGLARERFGDPVGAVADYQKALALGPTMTAARTRMKALQASLNGTATGVRAPVSPGTTAGNPPQSTLSQASRVSAGKGMAAAAAMASTPRSAAPPSLALQGSAPSAARTAAPLPQVGVAAAPPPAFLPSASSGNSRVLAPFKGYAEAAPCAQPQTLQGVPWRPDASATPGAVGSAQLGQYQALLRHTMEGLRVLYGPLAPAEEKNFDAFWAPYFDHPTKEALDYFQKITPLLDDMTVTLSNLDGLLPGMGEALQGTMLSGGDPSSGAVHVAAAQVQRVKVERARLDDLSKKIAALGNPPNPLAAECAAGQRHRKAVLTEDLLTLVKKARTFSFKAGQGSKRLDGYMNGDAMGLFQDIGIQKVTDWSWVGPEFSYAEQNNGDIANFEAPTEGHGGSRCEVTGTLSPDGKTVENLRFRRWDREYPSGAMQAGEPHLAADLEIANIPLQNAATNPDWSEITYAVEGAASGKSIVRLETSQKPVSGSSDGITITFKVGYKPGDQESRQKVGASLRSVMSTIQALNSNEDSQGTAVSASTEGSAAAAPAQPPKVDPANDPKVNAEAIADHLALADQTRRQADSWAADARNEKDSTRQKEMQARAAAMYANAQSERDTAESLRTGTIVHTPTDWDQQQHQAFVGKINAELTTFNAENKLLANLPKVGDMVAGLEGQVLRKKMEQDITEAVQSPDAVRKLAAIYARVQDKVIDQGQQQIADAQDKVDRWEHRITIAENVEKAAGLSVTVGALWAPAEVGTLALGYAGLTGFAEGGLKGATVAVVRSVNSRADAIISAYEGATKIDPATGQPGGAMGAIEGALWSIGTNAAMEKIGGQIQKAKAEYVAAQKAANAPVEKAGAANSLAQQAAGGAGVAPMSRAGEGRLTEFDFKTPEQRYKTQLEAATTPEAQAAVSQKYAIQEKRAAMGAEKDAAMQRADDAVRQGADPEKAKEQYSQDLKVIDAKYAAQETRNQEHQEVMKDLGFDPSYDGTNKDIMLTGGKPKTAESDMDFAPVGRTPHEAYQKGVAYTEALKKRHHNIDEYGDRWIDTTSDITIWKPGFGADKPGSSSFDAEVIFGSLPNSDKFGTKGGVDWTSLGYTDDPWGAVLANAGKAAGAGLGNGRQPDLHVIGKSASKALEILAQHDIPIKVDPKLQGQIDALRNHMTPPQAGVVDLGVDQATRDKQVKSFMDKVQTLMGQAIALARDKSEANAQTSERRAAISTPDQAVEILSKVQAYRASDKAAMDTIAEAAPRLAAEMGRSATPAKMEPSDPALGLNVGGLTRALELTRESDDAAPPPPADASDPAFKDLGRRCKQAAQTATAKLAAAKPGSDEARYLADLKTALEQGGTNPAEAVRTVRGLSGTELAVVLAQLGAPAK